ncbi:hypothetical protein ACOME3_005628 [Neoechinorhynchus agilis]
MTTDDQRLGSLNVGLWLRWLPFVVICFMGIKMVLTVAYQVATFNDVPNAAIELNEDLKEARNELKKMGVIEKDSEI